MNEFIRIALWAGIEDYSGLWEYLWEINSKFPSLPESERRTRAKKVITELLEKKWIKLFKYKEPADELIPINKDYENVLNNPDNWEPPAFQGFSIRFETTIVGEAAYQRFYEDNS